MADTDIVITRLTAEDAPAGLLLSTEAHWNQNEADWRFFLDQGHVFGVRDGDGRLIASAALLPYTSGNAWISMVLVTANWRRRGLATRMVDACLAEAAKQGLTTWLDATPAGATVYGPLGFTPTLELRRLRLESPGPPNAAAPSSLSSYDLSEFISRDCHSHGLRSQRPARRTQRARRFPIALERERGRAGSRRPQGAAHRSAVCR